MDEATVDSLKGSFLMAMPSLEDPNFSHTVVCLAEYTSEGALGLVINRVHPSLTAADIFKELELDTSHPVASRPIHIGGPVHMGEIFILHGPPFHWQGTILITASLGLSNTMDIMRAISSGTGPKQFVIAMGCAGWGPQQLTQELSENTWLSSPIVEEIIYSVPIEDRWTQALRHAGIDPSMLTDTTGHA